MKMTDEQFIMNVKALRCSELTPMPQMTVLGSFLFDVKLDNFRLTVFRDGVPLGEFQWHPNTASRVMGDLMK